MVWILLAVLAAFSGGLTRWSETGPIFALPAVGALTDLGFQRVRFPRLRFPDAALATSLFLVLIIWPSTVDLALVSVTIASVGLRHAVRLGGHPLLNPVAVGLTFGAVVFAIPSSWHVGVGATHQGLIVAFGALLVARAPHTWRLPVFYFAAALPLSVALSFLQGSGSHWLSLLEAGGLAPGALFYGFFMATEPRTAPSNRRAMIEYAALVGVAATGLPFLLTEITVLSGIGVLAPYLALFVGNLFTVALPSARGTQRATAQAPERLPARPAPEA
ncbi:MAG TPA: RnfABCDGE type electron transport complex subunit D [Thermoplasmata archaeon]|nr:RnfABCDGE type electron transport complex subunit D [Thermoplasmata archaeon]